MYFHNVAGTGSYTTSTTNMYNKDRFHVPGGQPRRQRQVLRVQGGRVQRVWWQYSGSGNSVNHVVSENKLWQEMEIVHNVVSENK